MSQSYMISPISRNRRISKFSHYRQEIEDLALSTSSLTPESASQANNIWREVNQIPLKGADSDELLLGVEVNNCVVNFFQESLPRLKIAETITLDLFTSKLRENVDRLGWEQALKPFSFLRSSVSFQTLNQRQALQQNNSVNKEKKQKQKKIIDAPTEVTQPTQVDSNSQSQGKEDVHADLVCQTLKRLYQTNKSPVEFWKFVTDPDSFENTVENMFAVNILVNNNKFQLISDAERKWYLKMFDSREKNVDNKKQMFLSICLDEYMERLKNLNITKPLIKRRKATNSDLD